MTLGGIRNVGLGAFPYYILSINNNRASQEESTICQNTGALPDASGC